MTTTDGATRLARSLGTTADQLPDVAAELTDDEAALFSDLLDTAITKRGKDIEKAVSDGLTLVPRPLRKPVMKLLGVGR